jgi:hypothetical protein
VSVARDLSLHAAHYYERAKKTAASKDGRESRALTLSARQGFTWYLGQVFGQCFGVQMPRRPNAGASPFLRFAYKACEVVGHRMVAPADPVTFPQDGGDYEAARALLRASESKLADDVRAIWEVIDKRKRRRQRSRKVPAAHRGKIAAQ